MKDNKNQSNTKLIKWIVIGTAILLIANLLIRIFLTEEPIPVSEYQFTNRDGSQTSYTNVVYTGSQIAIPDKLPLAEADTSLIGGEQIIDNLISSLSLSPHSFSEYIWQGDEWYLNYQPTNDSYILLNLTNGETQNFQPGMNEQDLINAAEKFKTQLLTDLNLAPQRDTITFLADLEEFGTNVTTPDLAVMGIVSLTYTVENYPVYLGKEAKLPFEFSINSNYDIVKLVFQPETRQPVIIDELDTISIDKAINNIEDKGLASILEFFQETGDIISLENLADVELTRVSIEYRLDENLELYYPFYRFTGTAQSGNDKIGVSIITPAFRVNL